MASQSVGDDLDVRPGDNVLLLCPRFTPEESAMCRNLATVMAPKREYVLSVLTSTSPRRRMAQWKSSVGATPAEATIISVGSRSAVPSLNGGSAGLAAGEDVTVREVGSLEDLTTLGVRIANQLDEWAAAPSEERPVVCFDSLSALAQTNATDKLVSFVDALTDRVSAVGGIGHFHADPLAHDTETIERLRDRFDDVYGREDLSRLRQ